MARAATSDALRRKAAVPAAGDAWLELPGKLLSRSGTLRLREPPGSNLSDLVERLRSGAYARPFVVDTDSVRRLHFSLDYIQAEMRLSQPDALSLAYIRKMMAFLLFIPEPRHVVIVGLGGASLTKFCHRQLPQTRVTTLEISDDVIAFAPLFHVPPASVRNRVLHVDAVEWFATARERADVVLIDGCDHKGVAAEFCSDTFYRDLHARLRPQGMAVMNLVGTERAAEAHVRHLAGAFAGRIMVYKLRGGENQVMFAFKDPRFFPDWRAIAHTAEHLQAQHGLDFPAFARRLQRSRQLQMAR